MKLLVCPKCADVFNLTLDKEKSCSCGFTKGKYVDNIYAEYEGGVPLGFYNSQFLDALRNHHQNGLGINFTAFAIRKDCSTFKIRNEAGKP
jgi:hypothetical protein